MDIKEDIQSKAISLLRKEITAYRNARVYITPKVSYSMREVINRCRKNYYGVFDYPYDEATGREKIWIPLTESTIENIVKNIDIDTKDINLKSKKPAKTSIVAIDREILRNKLRRLGFGEMLDEMERDLTIDGTIVYKTWNEEIDGKKELKCRQVDLLNFYIDPQAYSIYDEIQRGGSVIERSIISYADFLKTDWINKDKVKPTTSLDRRDEVSQEHSQNPEQVEIFYREGKFSKYFITGRKEDEEEQVFGLIIASGLLKGSGGVIHGIRILEQEYPSYEEAWYTRVHGRWYGRGVAEKLFTLQAYLNEIVNLRLNNSRILQIGQFKARRTAGITNKSLQNLITGGIILVDDLNDIEQFQMRNFALQDSLADENNLEKWSERVTQSYEISTGEQLPASTPATNAAIANQNVKSAFALIQEGIGMFLTRLLERQIIPRIKEIISADEILRITGEVEDLRRIDEEWINKLLVKSISDYILRNGEVPPSEFVEMERIRLTKELEKQGKERFVKSNIILNTDYEVEVYVTNEDFDKNTILQNLQQLLFNVSAISPNIDRDALIKEYLDLLGLSGNRFLKPLLSLEENKIERRKEIEEAPLEAGNVVASNQKLMTPGEIIANSTKLAVQGKL